MAVRSPRRSEGQTADAGVVVGVDLGGTRLRAGVVDSRGTILRSTTVPSSTGLPAAANPGYLAEVIGGLLATADPVADRPQAIGIGASGPVDVATGRIDNPHTLPGWSGIDLRGALSERFGVEVRIENDAAAAALGEYWRGAGRGSDRLVMITIGTGIGGALVAGGRIYRGAAGFHPELGHQIVDPGGPRCYCGAAGCWEQLVSGPAIARAWARLRPGPDGEGDPDRAADLFAAARLGDPDAARLVGRIGRYLGLGLVNVVAFYAPDCVVLGGGVADHFDLLDPGIRETLDLVGHYQPITRMTLHRSELAESAGILGAAYMVLPGAHL